jgi:flagellar basal-body rod protein FlgC
MQINSNASLSALNAYADRSAVTANNVANVNTDGYQASQGNTVETATGGVKLEISSTGAQSTNGTNNVDITKETVDKITTEAAQAANVEVAKLQDQNLGTLLDLIG